jgi:hypothetical protein
LIRHLQSQLSSVDDLGDLADLEVDAQHDDDDMIWFGKPLLLSFKFSIPKNASGSILGPGGSLIKKFNSDFSVRSVLKFDTLLVSGYLVRSWIVMQILLMQ